jgi:acetylornithine deacetylase/succinyl-diaminopimelate desuccinylase-like protein
MDGRKTSEYVSSVIDSTVIPTLCEYIAIPNLSPSFDIAKTSDSECEKVISLLVGWVKSQNVHGLSITVRRISNRTPLIFIDIPASTDGGDSGSILMYGHMDKQPPFEGWEPGLGPYKPVIKNGRLYGRGGADDGYSIFSSVLAVKAIQNQSGQHSRVVILIEASEESGSPDLMAHVNTLISDKLVSDISLVICLDSGSGDYRRL